MNKLTDEEMAALVECERLDAGLDPDDLSANDILLLCATARRLSAEVEAPPAATRSGEGLQKAVDALPVSTDEGVWLLTMLAKRRAGEVVELRAEEAAAWEGERWPKRCDWPKGKWFSVHDMPGEHEPCFLVMPGGAMVPFNHHATNGVDQARCEFIARACNDELKIIEQRDAHYERLDEFAAAAHFGIDIGEHSSVNCPWENAIEALATPPAVAPAELGEAAVADSTRLDWLESLQQRTEPGPHKNSKPWPIASDVHLRQDCASIYVRAGGIAYGKGQRDKSFHGPTLRAAIDAALAGPDATGGVE